MLSPAGIGWLDVETLNHPGGQPYLVLHGRASALSSATGLTTWSVSLTHDGTSLWPSSLLWTTPDRG